MKNKKSDNNNKMNTKVVINALAFKSLKVLNKILGYGSTITLDCVYLVDNVALGKHPKIVEYSVIVRLSSFKL